MKGDLKGNDVRLQSLKSKKQKQSQSPSLRGDLGVAQVINVNYEEYFVTLRIIIGNDFLNERVPVPITFPSAGTRHFLGAMPTVGDYCVVGWIPQDSIGMGLQNTKGTMTPVILTWIPRGAWLGHDWVYTSPLTEDDLEMSPKQKDELRGVYNEHRHKRPHLRPGDIFASSSKGSDILLNEGVYFSDRHGDEIRIRDQDQAIVMRSLQQFHVMSGVRFYGGMVQRDSRLLQGSVVSDGIWRSQTRQIEDGKPIKVEDLSSWVFGNGELAFAPSIHDIDLDENLLPESIISQSGLFLKREDGSVYGGKPLYRVAIDKNNQSIDNTLGEEIPTFVEHRVEVQHYSDGSLPVTEQTEGLDVDRQKPLIEVAKGTVVGNNPIEESENYAKVLVAEVFPTPQFSPLDTRHTLEDHIAYLFRVNSLNKENLPLPETWFAINKDGRVKVSIGGKQDTNSLDLKVLGKTRLDFSGGLDFSLDSPFKVFTQGKTDENNIGVEFTSEGAIVIRGKGKLQGDTLGEVNPTGKDGNPPTRPSVLVEGTIIHLLADEGIELHTKKATIQAVDQIDIESGSSISMSVGDGVIRQQSKERVILSTGKTTRDYSGSLTNQLGVPSLQKLPLRETTFTSSYPAIGKRVVDRYRYAIGSREESFTVGNHKTTMVVGNMTYELNSGKHTIQSGLNSQEISPLGYDLDVKVGNISAKASTGSANITGQVSAKLSSIGNATVQGATVLLRSNPPTGTPYGILSSATINPLNGLPFGHPANGMQGSTKHFIV